MKVFEKFAAFVFLLLLVGMVAFLAFYVVPDQNRDVVMMIVGAIVAASTGALPKLFGVEDTEKEKLKERVRRLEESNAVLRSQYTALHEEHARLIAMLVERHVVTGEGNAPAPLQQKGPIK